MFANVATWRVREPSNPPDEHHRFLREFVENGIEIARRAGVLDVVMVEIDPDQLVAISLFESAEDAAEANARLRRFVEDAYGDRLTTISRVTGRAYDPRQLHGSGIVEGPRVAGATGDMSASLVTWELDSSIRSDEAVEHFLQGIWERYARALQRLGLLDVVVVRIAEDAILAVRLYADSVEHDAAYQEAVATVGEMLAGRATFVSKQVGKAFDVPQLLGTLE